MLHQYIPKNPFFQSIVLQLQHQSRSAEQSAQEIALRLFQSGNSLEQIAQLTGIDIEAVKQWIEEAK